MANFLRLSLTKCCRDEIVTNLIVDDPTSAITTGNTYTITPSEGRPECYTVSNYSTNLGPSNATFTGGFTSCEECLSGVSTAVSVVDCIMGETFFIDINTFSTLPTIGDIHYLTFYVGDRLQENCFTIECFVTPGGEDTISSLISISES